MNTTIQRPKDKVHDFDLETEVRYERGVTAPAISPWSQETVEPGPFSRGPAPQTGARLERWIRGSFLRWLSLILFLVLLDVVVLLPLLTPATHSQSKSSGTRHIEGGTVVALHQGQLPVLTIRSGN